MISKTLHRSNIISTTQRIKGASWRSKVLNFELDATVADDGAIDVLSEIISSISQEFIIETELYFLGKAKQKATLVGTYDQNTIELDATFVGQLHSVLNDMIIKESRSTDNTLIVSPMALTIMQSAFDNNFVRTTTEVGVSYVGVKKAGTIKHLNVYVNPYADPSTPVLIGYIPEKEEERELAFLLGHVYGEKPNIGENWLKIDIVGDNVTFI